jgi:hypothetical protein
MANVNSPIGGRAINTLVASDFNSKTNVYYTSSADATPLFVGDFVKLTGVMTDEGIPYVTQAAATDTAILGVVTNIKNVFFDETKLYRAANTGLEIEVMDDPFIEFEVQVNGAVTASMINKKANLIVGAGNVITGMSGMQLDASTIGTGRQFLIIGGLPKEVNGIGMYAKVRCICLVAAFLDKSVIFPSTAILYVDNKRVEYYEVTGSILYPYRTIQAAINAAALTVMDSVTIYISPGTYVENLILENNNLRKVTLLGVSLWDTRIQPASGNAIQSTTNNTALTNISIQNLIVAGPVVLTGTASFLTGQLAVGFSQIGYALTCTAVNGNMYAHESTFSGAVTLTGINSNLLENIFTGIINVWGANQMLLLGSTVLGNLIINDNIQAVLKNNIVSGLVTIGINSSITTTAWCYSNQFSNTVTVNSKGYFSNNEFAGTQALDVESTAYAYGLATCHNDNFMTPIVIGASGILNLNSCTTSSTITIGAGGTLNTTEDRSSCNDGYVAHAGGGQTDAVLIKEKFVVIATVASGSDSCKLPHGRKGDWMIVRNNGANASNIYPAVGEYMDGFLNTPVSITNGTTAVFYCKTESHWYAAII